MNSAFFVFVLHSQVTPWYRLALDLLYVCSTFPGNTLVSISFDLNCTVTWQWLHLIAHAYWLLQEPITRHCFTFTHIQNQMIQTWLHRLKLWVTVCSMLVLFTLLQSYCYQHNHVPAFYNKNYVQIDFITIMLFITIILFITILLFTLLSNQNMKL